MGLKRCRCFVYFYPRPPRGGRPNSSCSIRPEREFLSTPSARRATHQICKHRGIRFISIHALREEGDASTPSGAQGTIDFYPRPPRGGRLCPTCFRFYHFMDFYPRPPRGGRHCLPPLRRYCKKFLSTPSARRATGRRLRGANSTGYFYPRPPRGGRRETFWGRLRRREFLSTPSARRATQNRRLQV